MKAILSCVFVITLSAIGSCQDAPLPTLPPYPANVIIRTIQASNKYFSNAGSGAQPSAPVYQYKAPAAPAPPAPAPPQPVQYNYQPAKSYAAPVAPVDSTTEVIGPDDSSTPENYAFQYEINDPATYKVQSQQEAANGGIITGSYTVLLPDGFLQIVKYTADNANGFQANIERQSGAGPVYVPPPTTTAGPKAAVPVVQYVASGGSSSSSSSAKSSSSTKNSGAGYSFQY